MTTDSPAVLSEQLGELLLRKRLTLATAESCTGGWVGQVVTAISGSSQWFDRGFITYSNSAKQEMLGVSGETIERFGAVSEQTAREMAAGALDHSHADVALAVTGVAGPTGGSARTPLGTVCFGWALRTRGSNAHQAAEVFTRRCQFDGDRESVRQQSVVMALRVLLERLNALPGAV